jgi:CHAD domain-containing protein
MRAALEASAAGREALDDPCHRWRTRVKDLLYQLRLFVPAWPRGLAGRVEDLDALGDALGEHHDLWLARGWLARNEPGAAAATAGALEERLAEARAIAERLGPRLYEEASGGLADEVLSHWRRWHRQEGGAPPP